DPENFKQKFPSIKLIKNKTNKGFAGGNNTGIQEATGEYLLLLNSDTYLKEDTISKSIAFMEKHLSVGVLGCRMTFPDGVVQHSARRFRSIGWELLDLFRFIPMLMPYKQRAKLMLGKYFRCDENIECDWVNGAFFMFPRKIMEQLPGEKLDDRFFMYGEDQLWCKQIKNLGYKIFFYSESTIIHINSASTALSKQLALRKIMIKNELEIMRIEKGRGIYYYLFAGIYIIKESFRNFFKSIFLRLTGRILR
ncbi:MAG: glycosyltransferase, partial [Bacteroidia bacterium]|nr:glycosyltransferase [Bacteroidia bacterium]